MKKILSLAFLLCSTSLVHAQKNVKLTITHKLGAANFSFTQTTQNNLGHNFRITRVDYYLSGFTIIHDGGQETKVPSSVYLLVKGNSNLLADLGNFNVTNVEGIKLHVGVESPTNNQDPTQWPASHPLSFQSPSMHWGWSSGYRFVALEGKSGTNLTTTWQLHGLFNSNYMEQTITVAGVPIGNDIFINLDADYTEAVRDINLNAGPNAHGSNTADLVCLQNFKNHVFKASPAPASLPNVNKVQLSVVPNPSNGIVQINAPFTINKVVLFDVLGSRLNADIAITETSCNINTIHKGVLLAQVSDNAGKIYTTTLQMQ